MRARISMLCAIAVFAAPAFVFAFVRAPESQSARLHPLPADVHPNISGSVNATVGIAPLPAAPADTDEQSPEMQPVTTPQQNAGMNWPLIIGIISLVILLGAGALWLVRRPKTQ